MNRVVRSTVLAGLAASALALSSCATVDETGEGGQSPAPAPPVTEQQPADPEPADPASPTGTPAETEAEPVNPVQGPERCETSELEATLESTSGAAGSTEITIAFRNMSERTCELHGFPGVSYVTGPDGEQVGNAASRTGSISGAVELVPSALASFTVDAVDVQNYPEQECEPTSVPGLRIFPPNDTQPLYIGHDSTACESTSDTIDQLSVTAVVAGLSE